MTVSASVRSMTNDPRREVDLAIERFVQLFVDVVPLEDRKGFDLRIEVLHPVGQLGIDRAHVVADRSNRSRSSMTTARYSTVELFAYDPNCDGRFAVEQRRTLTLARAAANAIPLGPPASSHRCSTRLRGPSRRRPHGSIHALPADRVDDPSQASCARVLEPLGDAVGGAVGTSTTKRPGIDTSWVSRAPLARSGSWSPGRGWSDRAEQLLDPGLARRAHGLDVSVS